MKLRKEVKVGGWQPVWNRRMGTFCSPCCGMGCKRADWEKARVEGDALAKRMGVGWVPTVWENMGWHYKVDKGVASLLRPTGRRGNYTVFFNSEKQVIVSGKHPIATVKAATAEARRIAARIAVDATEVMP